MARLRTESEIQKLLEEFEKLHEIADPVEMGGKCYRFLKELRYSRNEHPQIKLVLEDMKIAVTRLLQLFPFEEHSDAEGEEDGIVIDR